MLLSRWAEELSAEGALGRSTTNTIGEGSTIPAEVTAVQFY